MSDERETMSAGHDRMAEPVETMLKLHKDLPKAKTPHAWANGWRLTAYGMRRR
jgi:hypothetical protein